MYKGLILRKLKLRLMGAGEEEGSPPLSLANVLEEGCPRPSLRRTTTKPYNFRSTESLSRHIFTYNLFTDSATFNRQLLSWWYGKSKFFTMLWSNVNRFFTTGRERGDVQTVGWGDLPVELWGEIGKRLSSRLDILRFRSACKKWRSSLPSPTRFPFWVPPPPNFDRKYFNFAQEPPFMSVPPYIITEYSVYRCEGVRGMLTFEEVDQARRFYTKHIRRDRSGSRLRAVELESDCPSVSFMTSRANPYYRMTCVRKAYRLRLAFRVSDSRKRSVVQGQWSWRCNDWAKKIVIISSNAEEGVNLSYARASDLTAVALLRVGSMKGRLALLKLGGSSQDWAWDTDSCHQVCKDIGTYGGRLCTLDRSGRVFLMDYNSLKMTRVSPPLYSKVRAAFATLKV